MASMNPLISPCSRTICCFSGRKEMTVPSPVTNLGIGDHGPAVVHRQLALPGRHRGPLRLERLHKTTLADAPDPEVVRHLRHHLPVGKVCRLQRKIRRAGPLPVPLLAVAERALGDEDLLALGDHLRVRPHLRRNACIGIRGWYRRMLMVAMGVAMALGFGLTSLLLRLRVAERES